MTGRRLAREFVDNLKRNLRNMTSHNLNDRTRVSTQPPQIDNTKTSPDSYAGLEHPPNIQQLPVKPSDVYRLAIPVDSNDTVPGILHLPPNHDTLPTQSQIRTAAILLSGAGGGIVGPSSIYLSMGDKLASLRQGIPVLRLDYRFPARLHPCVQDVIAAMRFLESGSGIQKFVLVGWSFGSAPVFTVAAIEKAVVGCATIAGQTADTHRISALSPRPVLLLHGTGDKVLSYRCAERLYEMYGTEGDRRIELFEGDDHALKKNSGLAEEMLCRFIAECAGAVVGEGKGDEVVGSRLVGEGEKVELMERDGDLRGEERVN